MKDIAEEAQLLDEVGGEKLRLRFSGPFEGRQVVWDATFITLAAWQREHPQNATQQNFIEIADDDTPQGIPLTVGLNVGLIDLPTVRKAMTMIRQYKRLQRGRHQYG